MRNILLFLFTLISLKSYTQDIPQDSLILKTIFGKTDKNGKTFSSKYCGNENIFAYEDKVMFSVVFKDKINLDNKNLLLAVLEAPYGTQHGHRLGYLDIYFLKSQKGKLEIVDSIKSKGIIPIGNERTFEIVDIGKNKKALVSTFQSDGNQHFEKLKNVDLLQLNKLTHLFSICTAYDNSCCKIPETENDSCEAKRYEESFTIVKTNSEWFNIKVHHKDFGFTKGCRESFVTSESDKELIYFDGKYVEKNN